MTSTINTIPQILGIEREQWSSAIRQAAAELRVCLPGIITAVNYAAQTVTVQISVQETVVQDGVSHPKTIPPLLDVPFSMPRAGGYLLTLPPKRDDECFVVFSDLNYNAWWQSGGVQPRMDARRHDFSDAIAILGCWSQPRKVSSYSPDTAQLRNEAGTAYFELSDTALTMTFSGKTIVIDATGVTIEGRKFLPHHHMGVSTGTGQTGEVV